MNEARDQALEAWTLRLLLASGFESLPQKSLRQSLFQHSAQQHRFYFPLTFSSVKNLYSKNVK